MARYVVASRWQLEEVDRVGDVEMRTEVADLRDTRSQQVYRAGAYRVKAAGHRTRVFKGESAWSAAARYASDVAYELLRAAR